MTNREECFAQESLLIVCRLRLVRMHGGNVASLALAMFPSWIVDRGSSIIANVILGLMRRLVSPFFVVTV
jgi:hypothetical protein